MDREKSQEDWVVKLLNGIGSRPAIYNRNLEDYADRPLVGSLWNEVCAEVIENWNTLSNAEKTQKRKDIMQKWRNLRTVFWRYYKRGPIRKRRKYIYYDHMLFLVPLAEKKEQQQQQQSADEVNEANEGDPLKTEMLSESDDFFDEDDNTVSESFVYNDAIEDTETLLMPQLTRIGQSRNTDSAEQQQRILESTEVPEAPLPAPSVKSTVKEAAKRPLTPPVASTATTMRIIKRQNKLEEIDEDKYFLLSLIPSFRRMTEVQKIETKIEFLSVIRDQLHS